MKLSAAVPFLRFSKLVLPAFRHTTFHTSIYRLTVASIHDREHCGDACRPSQYHRETLPELAPEPVDERQETQVAHDLHHGRQERVEVDVAREVTNIQT